MSILGVVGAFDGVSMDHDGAIYYQGVLIGSATEAGRVMMVRLLAHPLDVGPISEEYPFVIPSEDGWMEVMLGQETDDSQVSALKECLNSAVDRVREAR